MRRRFVDNVDKSAVLLGIACAVLFVAVARGEIEVGVVRRAPFGHGTPSARQTKVTISPAAVPVNPVYGSKDAAGRRTAFVDFPGMPVTVTGPPGTTITGEFTWLLPNDATIRRVWSFIGVNHGECVEADINVLSAGAHGLLFRSEHKEAAKSHYDAWRNVDVSHRTPLGQAERFVAHWLCRTACNMSAQCHYGLRFEIEGGGAPPLPLPTPTPAPTPTPIPTPTPTPGPTPSPSALAFPIFASGPKFLDAKGRPANLLGAVVCCGDKTLNGWPLVSIPALEEIAAHGGNWTHVRPGPHSTIGPDVAPPWTPEQIDLLSFLGNNVAPEGDTAPSPSMWARLETLLARAKQLGVVVEIDTIDGWGLKKGFNYYGWRCDITQSAPSARQKQWIRDLAAHTARFDNVMYQISNESFACGTTQAWELGVFNELRAAAPGRAIGTNSHKGTVERSVNYVNRHEHGYLTGPFYGKPSVVNESGPAQTPADFEARARAAIKAGTIYHLWRGDMDDAQWQDALNRMLKLRGEF